MWVWGHYSYSVCVLNKTKSDIKMLNTMGEQVDRYKELTKIVQWRKTWDAKYWGEIMNQDD